MMWIVIAFDFPSDNAADYRRFRKSLLRSGFSFIQKSLCWRWVHSAEKADSIRNSLESSVQSVGKILCWTLPDRLFSTALSWEDGSLKPLPDPPDPWIIV